MQAFRVKSELLRRSFLCLTIEIYEIAYFYYIFCMEYLWYNFLYAAKGLKYAFSTQRNFRIHVGFALGAFGLSFFLGLNKSDLAIMALTATSVLVIELLNTAIESVVDLAIGKRFHPLAQIAKDCSAGAVLVASISSVLIAVLLLFPPLLIQLGV